MYRKSYKDQAASKAAWSLCDFDTTAVVAGDGVAFFCYVYCSCLCTHQANSGLAHF